MMVKGGPEPFFEVSPCRKNVTNFMFGQKWKMKCGQIISYMEGFQKE